MKSDVMGMSAQINKEELKELLKETKETIAVDAKLENSNCSFGAVDLWNVQKKHRTTSSMMRRWLN
jgi:translation elongation factor EF-1beta